MHYNIDDILEFLNEGEPARLIPVVADSAKEMRAVSILLASIFAVDEFRKSILAGVGAPTGKRSRTRCLTEIKFKNGNNRQELRPDGLIVARVGNRNWWALVEAKIGANDLSAEQVEAYLDLARENQLDAVITISNQFVPSPTHHPVNVDGRKLRGVSLYHWSWMSLVSEAVLLAENTAIADPDQAYILNEMIRYFQNSSSGALHFDRMGGDWKDICLRARDTVRLSRSDRSVIDTCASWHQLVRHLSLRLSMAIGRNVSVYLKRADRIDPDRHLQGTATELIEKYSLSAELDVPDAASRLFLSADLSRKTLSVSMRLQAPTDRHRASSCVTWIKNQLQECKDDGIIVGAHYPRKTHAKEATLGNLRNDQKILLTDNSSTLPKWFEIRKTFDNANKFSGPKTFVKEVEKLVLIFYEEAGQNLKNWQPTAPKILEIDSSEENDGK